MKSSLAVNTAKKLVQASLPILTPLVVPNGKLRTTTKERGQYLVQPTEIRTKERIYALSRPLLCRLQKHSNFWMVENDEFMIVACGATRQAAEEEFAQCFSELFSAYAESFTSLDENALALKNLLLSLVDTVYEATQK